MTRKIVTKPLSKLLDRLANLWLNRRMIRDMAKKPPKTFKERQDEAERGYVMRELVTRKNRGMSLRKIGEEVELSYEQVRQLLKKYDQD